MFNRRKKNFLWILVLVAVVIGVGTAFTAANTFDATAGEALGYGTQTVSGANVTSMHYTLAADGTTVSTVTFIADGDLTHGSPVEVGYVGFTYGAGTVGPNATCAAGSYDAIADATTFVCDVTGLVSAERTVAGISSTNMAVAN
jgi:hypothetical protein